MVFGRASHEQEKHGGKGVEWNKARKLHFYADFINGTWDWEWRKKMGQQYLTIDGTYVEGRIMPVSDILPRGSFHVLITFLAPLPDSRKGEDKSRGLMEFFQEEQSHILIHQLGITDRELEVLHLVQKGYTNTQIANELDLGSGTVRNYISALLAKVKAANRTQLVTIAKEKGILTD